MPLLLTNLYALLIKVGGFDNNTKVSEIGDSKDAAGYIEDFNGFLLTLLAYAGAIVIVVAIVQFVIAIQQQDASAKIKAAMTLGLGTILIVSDTVITSLNITKNGGNPEQTLINVGTIIGSALQVTAMVLLAVSVFMMILSFLHEDAGEKMNAGKLMGISIVLWGLKAIIPTIIGYALNHNVAGITSSVIGIIVDVARFLGVVLGIASIARIVQGLRDHDSTTLVRHFTTLAVAVVLTLMGLILPLFGITVSNNKMPTSSGASSEYNDTHNANPHEVNFVP